jgi:hypothetical protein
VNEVLLNIVSKTKEKYVIPSLSSCVIYIAIFYLWMSHARHDIFAMVVIFINDVWEPIHVTMGIFEMHNTLNATMVAHILRCY